MFRENRSHFLFSHWWPPHGHERSQPHAYYPKGTARQQAPQQAMHQIKFITLQRGLRNSFWWWKRELAQLQSPFHFHYVILPHFVLFHKFSYPPCERPFGSQALYENLSRADSSHLNMMRDEGDSSWRMFDSPSTGSHLQLFILTI